MVHRPPCLPHRHLLEPALLHSPSEALEGETAGLVVPAFVGLCTGDAGVDFTGEPGSSVASFSPENNRNPKTLGHKAQRDKRGRASVKPGVPVWRASGSSSAQVYPAPSWGGQMGALRVMRIVSTWLPPWGSKVAGEYHVPGWQVSLQVLLKRGSHRTYAWMEAEPPTTTASPQGHPGPVHGS